MSGPNEFTADPLIPFEEHLARFRPTADPSDDRLSTDLSDDDNRLIQCLLDAPTIAKAAELAGVSERTLYRRLARPGFRVVLENRQAGELRGYAQRLRDEFARSVDAIVTIRDRGRREGNRLRAAQTIVELLLRFFDAAFTKPQVDAMQLDLLRLELARKGQP